MSKQRISLSIEPELLNRLRSQAEKTGLKVNTIVEQGIELRIEELEKSTNA